MPAGDTIGYPQGHVGRVYEYLIAPACRKSGYFSSQPDTDVRIDPFEIVREIVESEVAIFDLSGNNANAAYGLVIRHALGLPFILVKDTKSVLGFSTPELDVIEYDESLRIDTVQKTTDVLSEALTKAVEKRKEKHEMLHRLGIRVGSPGHSPAPDAVASAATVHDESTHAEPNASVGKRLRVISPLPDYVGDPFDAAEILKLKPGDELFHLSYGTGKVNSVKKMGKDELANIQFDSGSKLLVLTFSDNFRKIKK